MQSENLWWDYSRNVLYLTIQANEDVTQIVEILPSVTDKWTWLTRRLVSFTSGTVKRIIIFLFTKEETYYSAFETILSEI